MGNLGRSAIHTHASVVHEFLDARAAQLRDAFRQK